MHFGVNAMDSPGIPANPVTREILTKEMLTEWQELLDVCITLELAVWDFLAMHRKRFVLRSLQSTRCQ